METHIKITPLCVLQCIFSHTFIEINSLEIFTAVGAAMRLDIISKSRHDVLGKREKNLNLYSYSNIFNSFATGPVWARKREIYTEHWGNKKFTSGHVFCVSGMNVSIVRDKSYHPLTYLVLMSQLSFALN